jgi:hypothetical protein
VKLITKFEIKNWERKDRKRKKEKKKGPEWAQTSPRPTNPHSAWPINALTHPRALRHRLMGPSGQPDTPRLRRLRPCVWVPRVGHTSPRNPLRRVRRRRARRARVAVMVDRLRTSLRALQISHPRHVVPSCPPQ